MDKEPFNYIDKPFRDAAEQAAGPTMPPDAWAAMEKLLDKKKRRRFGFMPWWTAGIVGGTLALTFLLWPGDRQGSRTGNQHNSSTPATAGTEKGQNDITVTNTREKEKTTGKTDERQLSTASERQSIHLSNDEDNKPIHRSSLAHHVNNGGQVEARAKQQGRYQPGADRSRSANTDPLFDHNSSSKWASVLNTVDHRQQPDHYLVDNRQLAKANANTPGALSPKGKPAIHFPAVPDHQQPSETPAHGFYLLGMAGMEKSFVAGDRMGSLQHGAQFAIGYQMAARWYLQTGLSLYNKKYGADAEYYYVEPGSYYSWPGIQLKWIDASCKVMEWSVAARYDVYRKKNSRLFAIAGIVSSQMKKEVYDYDYVKYGTPTKARHEYQTGKFVFANSVFAGAGFEKQLNARFSFQAATSVSIPVRGVGEGRVKLGAANIAAGIRYQLPF